MNSITPFSIYLYGLLDNLHTAAMIVVLVTGLLAFIAFLACFAENELDLLKPHWKKVVYSWLAILIFTIFMPSSKTYAAMVILPQIAQSDVLKKDVPEMYEATKKLLLETVKVKELPEKK